MFKSNLEHQKALKHLSKDPVLKKLIKNLEPYDWALKERDLFSDIVSAIVGQQLSTKAAQTIFGRFKALLKSDPLSPKEIIKLDDVSMREAGLSYSKIKYINGISEAVITKEIILDDISELSDEEFAEELMKLKGIGPWTAEMLLMFSLQRPDIFSIGDLGLRNAISKLYNIDRDDHPKIISISKNWSPYRTLASRYLWKYLDNIY